jgi:D-serine deaminase-like pyridoxal phosphate-dependent protein
MIKTPTLLINKSKVEHNINRMLEKAGKSDVIFRPHFKTHQSAEIGRLFLSHGITKITVSSVSMANYFATNGWNDITIAFPVNLLEIEKINQLAAKIRLNLLVDSVYSTLQLSDSLSFNAGIFIEIDNGYHRSGLLPEQLEQIDAIVETIDKSTQLSFQGFLSHAGNTYNARGKDEILNIMLDASNKLSALKARYINRFPGIITSYGDTPSCSMADDLGMFDEIRPGNFVYYDVMQYHIGSCSLEDIACAVACPVVSVYPERNELVINGGAVHLSKEFIAGDNDFKMFGYVVEVTSQGWKDPIPGAYVSSISQEHGIVKMPEERIHDFKPGDAIGVLPVHSCLTANLLKEKSSLTI